MDSLCSTSALLLIDNCEHVVGGVAPAVQALVQACRGIRIIATSRQPLNIPGEQLFRVPPLERDAAVDLFTERAKRAIAPVTFSRADYEVIERIVMRVDGIALAIELAAARTNILTLSELEHGLSERFHILSGGSKIVLPRQQAMRAAIDWSYDLLDSFERELFCRLWVFPSSFSLDAAVAICGDEKSSKWQMFEALASLVDKSLVNGAPEGSVQRYRLLETTRAYVAEHIAESPEAEVLRSRHAAYYGCVAQAAGSTLQSTDSTIAWARSLEPDLENFRAALNWALRDARDVAAGARLLADLQEFWIVQGMAAEVARRAHEVLERNPELQKALVAALWLTIARMRQELFSHPAGMLEAATKARELYEGSDDRGGLALAIRQQAAAHMRLGAYSQARDEFMRSLGIYRDLGHQRMVARGLGYLASLLQVQGEYVEARAALFKVLEMLRATGDDRMIPTVCMNLAETEFALGDHAGAAERARENLFSEILQKSCDMAATQEANLSAYLLALGQTEESRSMALASIEDGVGSFIAVPLQHLAASIARTDPASAAKILGYVEEAFRVAGFSRQYTERFTFDYVTQALLEVTAGSALDEYRREGASMNERQILDLAYGHEASTV